MKIVKIISIEDTREYIEQHDDTWVAIPGSGIMAECDRCGKGHEIHVTVELENGDQAVVGSGCAREIDMEREAQFKSLNSCEKTIQKLTRQLDKYRGLLDEYNEVKDMVDKMELPETTTKQVDYHGEPRYNLQMGDATVYSFREPDQERIDCVTNSWKYNRIKELGQNPYNGFAN